MGSIVLGFTGTRFGLTNPQRVSLELVFNQYMPSEFHHGACVGADEEAAYVALGLSRIVAHPGESARGGKNDCLSERAIAISDDETPTKTHFARNRDIVHASEVLIACPKGMAEEQTGGTWYTVNYARKQGVPVVICWPDGSVTREGF